MVREAVIAEAKSWLRTPYHHRGRLKGIGVDCAQFPMLVYSACGFFDRFDIGEYPADWHLHRSEERYLDRVGSLAREISEGQLEPGDFALFKIGRCFSHGAIVVAWPRIIHAVVSLAVVEDSADAGRLGAATRRFFTLW